MQMFPKMIRTYTLTTPDAIRQFESERRLSLPAPYKKFLLSQNGGVPADPAFPLNGYPYGKIGIVQSFKGIGVEEPTDELSYGYDFYHGGIPDDLLPIAGDGGGSFVCLDLRDNTERIAFWDHRHFWSTGEWREQDLYHVANSFEEFLGLLRPNPY